MTADLPPTLAERAALVLRDRDEGERYIPWAVLTRMPETEVELFQAALIHAMAADPYLDVKALAVKNQATGKDGLVIRWRHLTTPRPSSVFPVFHE